MNIASMDFFLSLMITFFVISILSQIMVGVLYQHMIEETENMSDTSNKILKQFKQKFINNYTLNDGMTNVSVFVDRFLGKLQLGKVSLVTIRRISSQSMLLSVLSVGLGICRELVRGVSVFRLFPYYIITLIGLYFYFSVLSMVDIPTRKNMLRTNLIDYLENHMMVKLESGKAFSGLEQEIPAVRTYAGAPKGLDWTAPDAAEELPEFAVEQDRQTEEAKPTELQSSIDSAELAKLLREFLQ